jgi:hypothetical protein
MPLSVALVGEIGPGACVATKGAVPAQTSGARRSSAAKPKLAEPHFLVRATPRLAFGELEAVGSFIGLAGSLWLDALQGEHK